VYNRSSWGPEGDSVMSLTRSLSAFRLLSLILPCTMFAQASPSWFDVRRDDFCVTEGAIEKAPADRLQVSASKMRAYVTRATAASAEMHFTYLGPASKESALGSGEMRRQFGLKLRAHDPCNLVYAMWRIDPEAELVVSLKRNPGQHTSAECTNHGYQNIKPRKASAVPHLQPGESHTLRAEMNGDELRVFVDDHEVWEGNVGADAAKLEGPVGLRSDNVRLEFDYQARGPEHGRGESQMPCRAGDSD